MSTKPTPKFAYGKWKFWFLAAYFAILTAERAISLAACFMGDLQKLDQLDYYMIMLTIFAIFGSYIFAVIRCTDVVKNHKRKGIFSELSVSAGILLLGGMVHTVGSIPAMQFTAYGMILISMALHTAQNVKKSKNADRKWLSFAYTVSYSMAIPVVYHTNISLANLFIPVECVVSAVMTAMFTIMLTRFYHGNGESNFSLLPFLIALFGDFFVLYLRWEEEVNVFVLIFLCVTTVLWFAGNVMCIKKKETGKKPADPPKK